MTTAKILVLRPEPGASRTIRTLSRMGYAGLAARVFTIAALDGGHIPSPPPQGFAGVVAASANAFAYLASESRARLADLLALVVGVRTADAAEAAGLRPIRPASRTAGYLVAELAEAFPRGHLLYLAGRERRPEIEAALAARPFGFTLVEVYGTARAAALAAEARDALRRGDVAAVLHYSERSARAYVALARQARLLGPALTPPQLCLSSAIATALSAAGAVSIGLASAPDETHMLALLPKLP